MSLLGFTCRVYKSKCGNVSAEGVNELARNLTTQVRSIGDVATAVTKGDYSQSVEVDARGEIATLKDNVNQMIATLSDSTAINEQQDWLKTNLAAFTRDELAAEAQAAGLGNIEVLDASKPGFANTLTELSEGKKYWKLCIILCLLFLALEVIIVRVWKS